MQTSTLMLMMMMAMFVWGATITTALPADNCLSATGEAAVATCRRELSHDPGNVDIRFALADAFMSLRRYEDAVAVLREGFEHSPGDDRIKKKLTFTESFLEEQQWIEKQKERSDASSRSKKKETQVRLSIIRCNKLKGDAAMAACNDGLKVIPDHPELLTGRGNVWLDRSRFGNAILDFQAALATDPKSRNAAKSLRLAQTKRKVKVSQCLQTDGTEGLDACDSALMVGASDEFAVHKRRAELLQAMGRKKEALEAVRIAARLDPSDDQVSASLAVLTPRSEKVPAPQLQESSPTTTPKIGASTVQSITPTKRKPPAKPVAQAAPPITTMIAESEPPIDTSPAKTIDRPAFNEPVVETTQQTKPLEIAANQPHRYSNLPEVPGITH